MEERSSSLVITGDPSGNFWICSIWSSLTEHDSVSALIRSLPQVLQRFINQQACGRCLVFLILLGHFSENLAGEYDTILKRLDGIVELGVRRSPLPAESLLYANFFFRIESCFKALIGEVARLLTSSRKCSGVWRLFVSLMIDYQLHCLRSRRRGKQWSVQSSRQVIR